MKIVLHKNADCGCLRVFFFVIRGSVGEVCVLLISLLFSFVCCCVFFFVCALRVCVCAVGGWVGVVIFLASYAFVFILKIVLNIFPLDRFYFLVKCLQSRHFYNNLYLKVISPPPSEKKCKRKVLNTSLPFLCSCFISNYIN